MVRPLRDSDFDELGRLRNPKEVLGDGERLKVPLRFADAADNTRRRTLDAALHRPGFRTGTVDDAAVDRVEDAYEEYEATLRDAWKHSTDDAFDRWLDAVAETTNEGGVEGDACTVRNAAYPDDQGSPGHLKMRNGKMVCVPDKPKSKDAATIDAREAAYQQYDEEISQRWRGS